MLISTATNAWTSEIRWSEMQVVSINNWINTYVTWNIIHFDLHSAYPDEVIRFFFSSQVLCLELIILGLRVFPPVLKMPEETLIGRRTPRPPAVWYVNQSELALSRCSKMPQVIFRAFQSSSAWMLCFSPSKGIAMIFGKLLFHFLCVSLG